VILHIALPTPLDRLFEYRFDGLEAPPLGARVRVNFSGRPMLGFVAGSSAESLLTNKKLKRIEELVDARSLFQAELWQTLEFAARYYQHSLGEVLSQALPSAMRQRERSREPGIDYIVLSAATDSSALHRAAKTSAQGALIELLRFGALSTIQLDAALPAWRAAYQQLAKRHVVERFRVSQFDPPPINHSRPSLNVEQQAALNTIHSKARYQAYLLFGITGSGKTEVYLRAIQQVLEKGQQALLLVPEIGLTPQTVQRIRERLAARVGVMHSNLSDSERELCWQSALAGRLDVVIGTRSAVFCQFPDLGLIVIDEEHDASYKQMEGFRYHARDLALKRAHLRGIPIILGSATPSLESLRNASANRLHLLTLSQRARAASLPRIELIDLRTQSQQDGLSLRAEQEIRAALSAGEQVLVFRNRRGFAQQLQCESCGFVPHCPRCEQALTVHRKAHALKCHYCGYQQPLHSACPSCHSEQLAAIGAGTERIQDALAQRFAEWPIVRIDRDAIRSKGALEKALARVGDGAPCILVGTQMLAKGHDFPKLTLVVVIGCDAGLHSLDFRASERLVQLLFQVSGRAGRAERPGRVLIQSHQPEHPLLQLLFKQNYTEIAQHLMHEREQTKLPPFAAAAMLRAESADVLRLQEFMQQARALFPVSQTLECFGPMPALLPKRAGKHRAQLVLTSAERGTLHQAIKSWRTALPALTRADLHYSLDIDPMDFS
jgi:primosomal protein N' (replication factor Y) (superfamily II helicase)